jgi:hypothetical protein
VEERRVDGFGGIQRSNSACILIPRASVGGGGEVSILHALLKSAATEGVQFNSFPCSYTIDSYACT